MLYKKGVLKTFTKFRRKQLCQSLFLPEACNFNKKILWHRCFSVNIVKFLKTPFCIEHLWWLLLIKITYSEILNYLKIVFKEVFLMNFAKFLDPANLKSTSTYLSLVTNLVTFNFVYSCYLFTP